MAHAILIELFSPSVVLCCTQQILFSDVSSNHFRRRSVHSLHNYRRCIIKILFILVQYSVLSLSLKSDYEFYFGSDFDLAFVQVKNFTRKIPANPKYPPTPQQYAFLENTMISYTRSRIQLRRVYFEESHEKPTWNHGKT